MKQSVLASLKVIASLPILHPYFSFLFKKKRFLRKSRKPGHQNLVLITSTVQVELSKLNYNFDDIRTYFLQALRDCRQIAFVVFNRFCPLSKKNPPPLLLTENIEYQAKSNEKYITFFYIVFQVLKHQQISFFENFQNFIQH